MRELNLTALESKTWLIEIGQLLEDCLAARDEDAERLVRRFLNLMALSPLASDHLLVSTDDIEELEPYFELCALESLLLRRLGDAIGICMSISADKKAVATAYSHGSEQETTFDSGSMPVALTGAIAMLAARDVQAVETGGEEATLN